MSAFQNFELFQFNCQCLTLESVLIKDSQCGCQTLYALEFCILEFYTELNNKKFTSEKEQKHLGARKLFALQRKAASSYEKKLSERKCSVNASRRQICKVLALSFLPCLNPFWTMWVWAEGFLPIYSSGWHQIQRLLFLAAAPPAESDRLETQKKRGDVLSCLSNNAVGLKGRSCSEERENHNNGVFHPSDFRL